MNKHVKVSLVTTCKGRLSYLKESIKTWLDIAYDNFDIVVVDYDCPDSTQDYIKRNRERMLRNSKASALHVVKVHDRPRFNLCDARNIGIDSAQSELILMIDADVHITDKHILSRISRRFEEGIVFFSNVVVLSTRFSEGLNFYRLQYGIERMVFHALLPTHCKTVGLSGSACFLKSLYLGCGKYRPEISKQGWGSDDIEFYIRYLNHFFYNVFLKEKTGANAAPGKHLDAALRRTRYFPTDSFDLRENTTEEKTRFYDNPKLVSSQLNKSFIHELFQSEDDRFGWIMRKHEENGKEISILKYRRHEKFPIPSWFPWWYNHFVGQKLLQLERPMEAIPPLKKVLNNKNTEPLFLARTYFLLGDACEKMGKSNWKYYYRKGLLVLTQKTDKTRDEIYTIASTLKRLNRDDEAVPLFKQLISGDKAGSLWDGCYFHLGEIFYRRKRLKEAETMFSETLKLNPAHGKAREYLKKLSPGESHA